MSIEISTDRSRLDIPLIHDFLSNSYWATGRPREVVERSIKHSLCFGAYENGSQVAFARLVTDRSVFAYLADVFVVPNHRARGISRLLLDAILVHPELKDVRLFRLATRDAHGLYAKYGFKSMVNPEKTIELFVDALE
jgi:N-acetylglutamate synthase-like GNAT family acetyltransferase